MKSIRSVYIILMCGMLLFGIGCQTKDSDKVTTSVEEYYKGQLPTNIKAIASDWDKVISTSNWSWLGVAWTVKSKLPLGLKLLFTRADVRADIKKAIKLNLVDNNGKRIYGTGNFVDYFAQKYNPSITEIKQPLVNYLGSVIPIASTVYLYQETKLPVAIWTNNDYESYKAKLDNLNGQLQSNLNPVAAFVAGDNPDSPEEAFSIEGKPSENYYAKAYAYTKKQLNLGDNDVIVFVDDQAENIDGARETAKKFNLPIVAVQYTTPEQLKYDFDLLTSPALQNVPVFAQGFMEPKELDDYLFNREARIAE